MIMLLPILSLIFTGYVSMLSPTSSSSLPFICTFSVCFSIKRALHFRRPCFLFVIDVFYILIYTTIELFQYCLPHLRKTKGCIVNIGSVASSVGQKGCVCYSATKVSKSRSPEPEDQKRVPDNFILFLTNFTFLRATINRLVLIQKLLVLHTLFYLERTMCGCFNS